jgi:hypothetical protein
MLWDLVAGSELIAGAVRVTAGKVRGGGGEDEKSRWSRWALSPLKSAVTSGFIYRVRWLRLRFQRAQAGYATQVPRHLSERRQ